MKTKLNLIFLAATSIVVRFLFLGLRPLEGDEGIIIKIAQSPNFSSLLSAVSNDVHPPLYHFLEFVVFKILPLSEFSSRLISALAGLMAVYFIYLVFKKIADEKTAVWVALLSVVNPVLTYHFAEARPYSLLILLIFAQINLFLKIKDSKKENTVDLILFGLVSILMVLTQYIGFAIFVGEFLYLAISEGLKSITIRKILSALVVFAAFALLWGEKFLNQLQGRLAEQPQALDIKGNLIGVFNAFYRFLSGRLFLDLDPSLSKNLNFFKTEPVAFLVFLTSLALGIGLLILGSVNLWRKKREHFWLIFFVFAPAFVLALVSAEVGPRSVRYLAFFAPFALYIVLNFYSSKIYKKILLGIFLIIYIASFVSGFYFERQKPGVNKIAATLIDKRVGEDRVLIAGGYGGGEELVLRYYLGSDSANFTLRDLYSDYKVGNLEEIKARKVSEEILKLKQSSAEQALWFYDFTYKFDESSVTIPFEKFFLGEDKENKELVLYKF